MSIYKTLKYSHLATAAQGTKADSAVQPSDNISVLNNDSNFQSDTQVNTTVNTAISGVKGSVPVALDTLEKIATSINNDANVYTTLTSSIGNKLDASAVSTFGLTLVDDADAATARTTLGVDAAGTDNSTDVTLAAGSKTYITLSGQELTIGAVPSTDITGLGTMAAETATDYVTVASKGSANGVASLDSNGKVPAGQLPSYVDDVEEYANFASFPGTGETGKLYIDIATGDVYRWSGSVYVQINDAVTSADQATALATARDFSLTGDVTAAAVSFDGTGNVALSTTVTEASVTQHQAALTIAQSQVTNLTTDLAAKLDASSVSTFGGTLIDDADAATARTTLGLGTAATTASTDYATAAQGALADTALQNINSESIDELSDVDTTTSAPTDGQVLTWNNSGSKWEPQDTAVLFTWESTHQTSNFTAVAAKGYFVDSSSVAVTVTLPASPVVGDEVAVIDSAQNAATNNITVARNGNKIMDDASDMTVAVDGAAFRLVWSGSTRGWLLSNK